MFYLGCFYLWGNIDVYVLSYFHEFNPNLSYGFIFIVDTLLITANSIGYNIGSFLLQSLRLPPKLVVGFGGSFALVGVFLSSYTKRLGPYLSLYTGMNGLGCGMCYMVPLICAWEYFPEKKGLMTGIIIGAYGFGSFIFALVSSHLVNPNKENPTINAGNITYFAPDVADRVPYMIRTLAYIWSCFVAIAVILITRKPTKRVKV
jgi:MFS transporter, OFA family, oxalate/formate antiporter